MALLGALAMMKLPQIDLLVVGLPVALLALKKVSLEKAMTGNHQLAGGRTITVRKALAVAQPQGALVHYAAEHEKMTTIGSELSLVVEPGARTFDWLVCRGMRLVQKQSHSINRGMADVLRLIAAEISRDIGTPYRDIDAIDLALRTGKAPVIFQKPYDIKRHPPIAEVAFGQTKRPRSNRLASNIRPCLSTHSTLMMSPRRPRKTKTWPLNEFSASAVCTSTAQPTKPLRMSVGPAHIGRIPDKQLRLIMAIGAPARLGIRSPQWKCAPRLTTKSAHQTDSPSRAPGPGSAGPWRAPPTSTPKGRSAAPA